MRLHSLLLLAFAPLFLAAQPSAWIQKAPFPGLPGNHILPFGIGDYGYTLSAWYPGTTADKRLYRYDPKTNSWTGLGNFPGFNRGYAVSLSYKGKGYVGFGAGPLSNLNDLWEYDPATDKWTQLPNCTCSARLHPAFVAHNDKIYVGMGGNQTGDLDDWWAYDLNTRTWARKAKLPASKRHHPYYFALGDYVYVGFGHSGLNIFADFYRYDPATDKWERKADIPGSGRVAGTQFDYNGKGYVVTGQDTTHQYNLTEFWEYDPLTDKWETMPEVEWGLWAPGLFMVGNVAYMVGGDDENGVKKGDLWAFSFPDVSANNDLVQSAPLNVFPNPTQDGQFALQCPDGAIGPLHLDLMDAQGRTVASKGVELAAPGDLLPFSAGPLPPGMYLLRLQSGNSLWRQKVVIR